MSFDTIKIAAVGDLMLGDGIQRIRRGVRAAWRGKDSGQMLQHLRPVLAQNDLCIGNLECILGEVGASDPRKMVYTGEAAHVTGLKAVGFTHLSLANNHILEQGLVVAEATRVAVEHAGMIACCGVNPLRSVCQGKTIDIFTFNLIHDTPSVGFYRDRVGDEDFHAISVSDAAVKIVCIHWGNEYSEYPSPEQIDLAHRMADCGACLILGHHPHVVQGVEEYRGAVIAYSLGNFIFDMTWSERTRSAFILKVEIEGGKARGYSKIYCRDDDAFVPRLAPAFGEAESLDTNVLRFQNEPEHYRKYSQRSLNRSRLQAIFHLLGRFHAVDFKTWEILIGRRFKWLAAR